MQKLSGIKFGGLLAIVGFMLLAAGCSNLDVVATGAVTSFTSLVKVIENRLDITANRWEIITPDNQGFSIAADFTGNEPDFILTLDGTPFLAGGLDPSRLPANYLFDAPTQKLSIRFDIGSKALASSTTNSLPDFFRLLVATYREHIGYHEDLDHFGINLGDGNMFEWARDITSNDKDAVIVLNPEPFIKAGADPNRITGWVFAKINLKEPDGRKIQVDKLLKPYNLTAQTIDGNREDE